MKKMILLFTLLSVVSVNKTVGYCDIKGSVDTPGVYKISKKDTIYDIIKKAGGLKNDAYTDNINLSKIVNDEMVIYIHNKKEINKAKELNNCVCEPIIEYTKCNGLTSDINNEITKSLTTTTTKKIETTEKSNIETTNKIETTKIVNKKTNINLANLEELISLNGLGESKATKIIDYRNKNGFFKSIEELLNVDGIGNKTFENIKDFIEV